MALRPFILVARVDKLRRYRRRVYCIDEPDSITWRLMATLRRRPLSQAQGRSSDSTSAEFARWLSKPGIMTSRGAPGRRPELSRKRGVKM
jgi:hypothetical protein